MDVRDETEREQEGPRRARPRFAAVLSVIVLIAVGSFVLVVIGLGVPVSSVKTVVLLVALVVLMASTLARKGSSRTAVKGSPAYMLSETARETILRAEEIERESPRDMRVSLILGVAGVVLLAVGLLL